MEPLKMTNTILLRDIGRVITGKTTPKANPEYWGNELDFITPSDFTTSKFIEPKRKLSSTGSQALRRITCPPYSVIVTCIGSDMGKVALSRNKFVSNQQINTLILDSDKADANFIYYLLKSNRPLLRKYAESSGSTMPIINKTSFERLSFDIPDIQAQKKIADILGTIDEKIELNRKINETLEQMGQALFKYYFITNPEAKNWSDGKFSDVADVLTGKGSTRSQLSEDGRIPLYGANGIMGTSEGYLYNERLVITGRVGTLGKVRAVTGKAWFSDNVLIMKSKIASFGFIYYLAKSFDYISMNRGSTQPLITQTDLKNRSIKIPDEVVLKKFEDQFLAIFDEQQNNEEEIQTLTALRDTLLPRLISGKVKV
jgi:type I restriction enzyme S subunit